MRQKELADLTDEELLEESKKNTLSPLTTSLLIGFLCGIVFYSVVKSSWGFFTLIPLFLAYKLIKDSKRNKEVEQLLKDRNLK